MEQLTEADYPELKFILMTNGMLFTPRQWEAFVEACRDPRLRDPMVWPSDLDEFINAG